MMLEPTAEQAAHGDLVQAEALEMVDRLRREGIDTRVILAGLSAATAATVAHHFGPGEVFGWFAGQAALAMQVPRKPN